MERRRKEEQEKKEEEEEVSLLSLSPNSISGFGISSNFWREGGKGEEFEKSSKLQENVFFVPFLSPLPPRSFAKVGGARQEASFFLQARKSAKNSGFSSFWEGTLGQTKQKWHFAREKKRDSSALSLYRVISPRQLLLFLLLLNTCCADL